MASSERWECSVCTYSNEPAKTVCEMCNTAAPPRASLSRVTLHQGRPSDIEMQTSGTTALTPPGRTLSSSIDNGGGSEGKAWAEPVSASTTSGTGSTNRYQPPERSFSFSLSEDVQDGLKCACAVLAPICALLLIILLSISFHYVEYDEYGLKKDTTTSQVQYAAGVFDTGRYCWGPGYTTLPFAKLYQTVEFKGTDALSAFTNSGVNVTLEVSFQYRIQKAHVIDIFRSYGTDYEAQVQNVGRAAIKNAVVNFGVNDFFLNRQGISTAILTNLQTQLAQVWSEVPAHKFQLQKVGYPDVVTARYLNSALVAQATLTNIYQQAADIYRADTNLTVAEYLAQAQVVNTSGVATISQIGYQAGAQAYRIRTEADGYGIQQVFQMLNLTDIDLQQQYLTYYRASQNTMTTAIFGMSVGNSNNMNGFGNNTKSSG